MIDTVHTYYEPVPEIDEGVQRQEIEIWRQSWERWGWKTTVLGRADVEIEPAELARLERLPSASPPGYDLACYLRWFAMRARGGGLLTDYDVVNVGLRPFVLSPLFDDEVKPLAAGWVPCAIQLSRYGAADWCASLRNYEPLPQDQHEGRPHVSVVGQFRSGEPSE